MPKCKDFGPKINVSQKRKRVDKAVSRKFPQSENWISKNELKRKIFKYMTGGRGSSSTPPRAGIVNSLALVWLIKKFGVGFGISSCDKIINKQDI
jgi:hypothetical protein